MFVKILKRRKKNIIRETLHECGSVAISPEGSEVKVAMDGCPPSMGKEELFIPCEGEISIYLMNQQGKTIDSFKFGEKNVRSNN